MPVEKPKADMVILTGEETSPHSVTDADTAMMRKSNAATTRQEGQKSPATFAGLFMFACRLRSSDGIHNCVFMRDLI